MNPRLSTATAFAGALPSCLAFCLTLSVSFSVRAEDAPEGDMDNFREDVFACEEAVAHLASCCPAFQADTVRCVHSRHRTGGCYSRTEYREDPAIAPFEVECVLALDCAAIRERGICERASRLKPERSSSNASDRTPTAPYGAANPELLCP